MHENALSREIIGAGIEVHRVLGPGLLESVYERCLAHELGRRGVVVERQKSIPVRYKGVKVPCGFRVDLLVGGLLIVEVKAVAELAPVHDAQLLTYLKSTGKRLGLILNFHVPALRDGIRRLVLDL